MNINNFKNYKVVFSIFVLLCFVVIFDVHQNILTFSSSSVLSMAFAQSDLSSNPYGIEHFDDIKRTVVFLAFVASFLIIGIIVYVFKRASKQKSLRGIILNEYGYPTLSKFQFLLWTLVIAFVFLAIQITRIAATDFAVSSEYLIQDIPENLLVLMGISVAVPIISSKSTDEKKICEQDDDDISSSFGMMFYNKQGNLDLARLQMFLWTIIGIVIYLYIVFDQFIVLNNANDLFLPDVSPTLLILMGLSQGAYLGSKFAGNKSQDTRMAHKTDKD